MESDTEEDVGGEEEKMPERTGVRNYDTPWREGRYVPIRANPEDDVIEIHTDSKIPQGTKFQPEKRR